MQAALRLATFFVIALIASGADIAHAQICRWDGTAIFCDGSCGDNETEFTRASSNGVAPPGLFVTNPFGNACATGTKALCCATQGRTCRWDGTAPFCEGGCEGGETPAEPPAGSSSGSPCWTGSKVYCCRSTTNPVAIRQRLEATGEFTRYAAVWQKISGPAWQARHGLTAAEYQQDFNRLRAQGYRLIDVSGYGVAGEARYATIWVQTGGPPWQARHGLTASQYQTAFDQMRRDGYRLVHVSGYGVAGQARYAAIWEKSPGPEWIARHGLTAAQYQQAFDANAAQGYRLVDISGYAVGNEDRYAALWEKTSGLDWQARHGLTPEQYQAAFNEFGTQGYRLVRVRGWAVGAATRYAAIWIKERGPEWIGRHGMLSDAFQEEFNFQARDGYRLTSISGYQPSLE